MKNNKFSSYWYSIEKIQWDGKQHHYVKNPNGYLYSKSKYNTKIKAEDLPKWYIYGRFYKRFGYLSAKGVIDLHYIPNKTFNHFLRDDLLIISYNKKIDKNLSNPSTLFWVENFAHASGCDIINMLIGIKKYSNYDIEPIVLQIKDKLNWFKEHFPEDYARNMHNLNFKNIFKK